jgi:hypothetical protein
VHRKPIHSRLQELLQTEPDGGTTNIRNVKSKRWTRRVGALRIHEIGDLKALQARSRNN